MKFRINRLLTASCMVLAGICTANAQTYELDDKMYFNDFSIEPGQTVKVDLQMENQVTYIGLQYDIHLPKGLHFATNARGKVRSALNYDRVDDHMISDNTYAESNGYRALIVSLNNYSIYGNEGTLVSYWIVADEDVEPGEKTIELYNVRGSSYLENGRDQVEYLFTGKQTSTVTVGNVDSFKYTLDESGKGTLYYSYFDLRLPENLSAVTLTQTPNGFTSMKTYENGMVIPRGEPVMIVGNPGEYILEVVPAEGEQEAQSESDQDSGKNILCGTDYLKSFTDLDATDYYELKDGESGHGWYKFIPAEDENNPKFYNQQHSAYVALAKEAESPAFIPNVDISTGISSPAVDMESDSEACYDLTGNRVNPDAKGIVIRNGKKILNN